VEKIDLISISITVRKTNSNCTCNCDSQVSSWSWSSKPIWISENQYENLILTQS